MTSDYAQRTRRQAIRRILIGAAVLLLSLVPQYFPRIAPHASTHMCEYVHCTVQFTGDRGKTAVDPDDFHASQLAAEALSSLVRDHFGDDRLQGS